jgi:hypothetical protein
MDLDLFAGFSVSDYRSAYGGSNEIGFGGAPIADAAPSSST